MPGPASLYAKEISLKFGYLATWFPNTEIELGDVGLIEGDVFTKLMTLKDVGINFEPSGDSRPADFLYKSASVSSFMFKAKGVVSLTGSGLVDAKAGVSIGFGKDTGVVFAAKGCKSSAIRNQQEVGDHLKELYRSGKWNREFYVVTEVVKAESFTVFVSEAGGGKLDLVAEGDLSQGLGGLADLKAGLAATRADSMQFQAVAQAGLVPLFRARQLRRPFFRLDPIFSAAGVTNPMLVDAPSSVRVDELSFDEYVPGQKQDS